MNKLSKAITFAKIVGNSYSKKIIPSISSMDIIITDLCNLSCKMCEVRYFKKRSIMPYDTFKKLIDEGTRLGLKKVNLAASGESTLHPDFPKMAEYASSKNIELILVTNLNTMNEDILNALKKFKQIHISVDGCTKETYEKIRIGAKWETLTNNIKELRKVNKDAKIVANFCIQKDNYKELPLLCDTFLPLGINEIHLGMVSGILNKQEINDEGLNDFLEICKKTRRIFVKNNLEVSGILNVLSSADISEMKDLVRNLKLDYDIFNTPCYHYHINLFVTPTGNIYPCCFGGSNEGLTGNKTLYAGNINENSLKEIWTSNKMDKLRTQLLNKELPELCKNCSNGVNKRLDKMLSPFMKKHL